MCIRYILGVLFGHEGGVRNVPLFTNRAQIRQAERRLQMSSASSSETYSTKPSCCPCRNLERIVKELFFAFGHQWFSSLTFVPYSMSQILRLGIYHYYANGQCLLRYVCCALTSQICDHVALLQFRPCLPDLVARVSTKGLVLISDFPSLTSLSIQRPGKD